ncbi:acyl thioesterase 1 [Fusarium beomiforme]|uniref:Acyl thioesterase 1 n=1 Tax=Fusarium beomiforme TaxID=44412 RepID=A0A9P5AQG7_9HYPO|nr:acyl thioesterase 1 [Fusarium beomiforme]
MPENSSESFGPMFTIEPLQTPHTHTAILLHGRGSNGEEFARELFGETLSPDHSSLLLRLPNWRWVFPSSRGLWSATFQEYMPAWFEAHSLTDTTARQDLQTPGIEDSVSYLMSILNGEVVKVGGDFKKIVLGGISQGAAVGMWTLLCINPPTLGAFFGTSTWLPLASDIKDYFSSEASSNTDDASVFVDGMLAQLKLALNKSNERPLLTPVFLGHGTDDAYVDVKLGREARDVLTQIGFTVLWKEYQGAEQEGHWIKEPEEVDDLVAFLLSHVQNS